MKPETLFNPQSEAWFDCVIFASKESKLYVINLHSCKTIVFFYTNMKLHFPDPFRSHANESHRILLSLKVKITLSN